jgi:hypothetical protein
LAIYDEAAYILGCVETHTRKEFGRWRRGSRDEFGILVDAGGRISHRMRCMACGTMSSNLPINQWRAWGITDVAFTDIREPGTYDPCVVTGCQQPGREEHHFAPRNTFGDEADHWPTGALCRKHHHEWHRRMDGYRWHRRAAAQIEAA